MDLDSQCVPNGRRRHDDCGNGKTIRCSDGGKRSPFRGQEEQVLGKGRNPVIAYGSKGRYVAWDDVGTKQAVLLSPGTSKPVPLGKQSQFVDLASSVGKVVAAWEEIRGEQKVVRVQVFD